MLPHHQSLPSPATPPGTSAEVLTETARAQPVDLSLSFLAHSQPIYLLQNKIWLTNGAWS